MSRNVACRGFVLVELVVALAVIAIVAGAVVAQLRPAEWVTKARVARAKYELTAMRDILAVYYADRGQGSYPAPDNTVSEGNSVAAVLQAHGVRWADAAGPVRDPWGSPYYYDAVLGADGRNYEKFVLVSPGPDRSEGNGDDIYCTNTQAPVTGDPTEADPPLGATKVASVP